MSEWGRASDQEQIEDQLVMGCYYVQQKTPVLIDDNYSYSRFIETLNEFSAEQKREEKASRR
jgi:hypothetical protein